MHTSAFVDEMEWPEWFSLDFALGSDPTALDLDTPNPLLILGIAKEPLHRIADELLRTCLIANCKKQLQEHTGIDSDFLLDIDKPWGFGGILNPYRRAGYNGESELIEFAIPIPQVEKDAGECEECGGEKEMDGMDCIHCMGTGRETRREWYALDRIAATLYVLQVLLDIPNKELVDGTCAKRKQLLSVRTSFRQDCAFINATLSRTFGNYLRSLSRQELPEVKKAIKSTYLHMFPSYRRFDDFHFQAHVRDNGQLIIDVPGDACGLYVDGFSRSLREPSGPMELDCHNVDGHHQMLTLLCGLAALTGTARNELCIEA